MSRDFDVVIVGAGVIGTVMAALLLAEKVVDAGALAVVADRMPVTATGDDWDLRVFALNRSSQRILEACGAWHGIDGSRMHAYERMTVWAAEGTPQGAGSLTFDSAELGEPNLGWIVEGRALQARCLAAAQTAGAVFIEAGLEQIVMEDAGCRLSLSDGRELRSRLLIGADGMDSRARELLGIATSEHVYHQDALVAHVSTEIAHRNTAYQRFLRSGPLALLPLPDGRSSIVWSAQREEAGRLAALEAAAFGAAVTAASDGVLGRCELQSPVARFPLKSMSAVDYVRPHAALIGDAAHVVHPLAGQGLNLGMLDCAALSEVLGRSAAPGDYRALRCYERWRRSDNLVAASVLDSLERMFSSGSSLAALGRTRGLQAVGKLPLLRRELVRRALGVTGDVPALVKADALNRTGGRPSRHR